MNFVHLSNEDKSPEGKRMETSIRVPAMVASVVTALHL